MYPLVINLRIGISSGNFLPRMFICFSQAYETSLVFFHPGTGEGGPMCSFFSSACQKSIQCQKRSLSSLAFGDSEECYVCTFALHPGRRHGSQNYGIFIFSVRGTRPFPQQILPVGRSQPLCFVPCTTQLLSARFPQDVLDVF